MRKLGFSAWTALVATMALSCGSPSENLGTSSSSIIGGADDPSDPAVVAIVSDTVGLTLCTGTLVGPRAILTAGHCNFTKVTARFGADVSAAQRTITVAATVLHPKYTKEGAPYDFALLELETPVNDITPLPLRTAPLTQADVGKTMIRHVGFGVSDEAAATGAGHKRTVTYPITKVTDVLVYSGAAGKQTCDIDSGAPGLIMESDGIERIAGVVSDGPSCHEDGWDGRADLADLASFVSDTQKNWDEAAAGDVKSAGCSIASDRLRDPTSSRAKGLVFAAFAMLGTVALVARRRARRSRGSRHCVSRVTSST